MPVPPKRHPIVASRVVNAYKAYGRPAPPPRPGPERQDTGPRDPFLAGREVAPAVAGDLPDAFAEEEPAGDAALQDARTAMEAMQRMLSQLSGREGQDPGVYKELFVQYRRLSDLVKQDQAQAAHGS